MDGGRVTVNGQLMRERARKQRKEEQGREGGREGVPSVDLLLRSKAPPASVPCLLLLCLCLKMRRDKAAPHPEGSDL